MTATPVVSIPLSGDQLQIAAHLLHQGVSVNLDLKTVTKEAVLDALNSIISNRRYEIVKKSCYELS